MSHTTLLEDIKANLDRVDAESWLSIREIIDQSLRKISALTAGSTPTRADRVAASHQQLKFIGENLLPEEYEHLSLEERASLQWQATIRAGDYYPTLPVKVGSAPSVVKATGDFDTGSSHTFLDYDFLAAQNIIRPELRDYPENSYSSISEPAAARQTRMSKNIQQKRISCRHR